MSKHGLALAALAIATLVACANKPSSIVCASGIVCPAPLQCAAVQPVCISNDCGNGIVDPGEVCDDGNIMDGDGCSHDCLSKEACGNGVVDPNEVCDDGNTVNGQCGGSAGSGCNQDSDCGAGVKCVADKCSHDCKSLQVCGNDIVDFDEVCDDGGTSDGKCPDGTPCNSNADCSGATCSPDGCSRNCESNETCGNGIVDLGEVCDNGSANGSGKACEANCQGGSGCGNHIIDPGEQCDDGNTNNDDDCVNCKLAKCGDGYVDNMGSDFSEECDPGSAGETSTCNANCTTPTCGDGIVNPLFKPDGVHGEQCDNGSANSNSATCTATCLFNVCGDGNKGPGEDCDAGSANGTSSTVGSCDSTCHLVGCGNGIVDPGEQCDPQTTFTSPSNPINTALCDSNCTVPVCGDNFTNPAAGEACDQGSANGTPCPYASGAGHTCDRCSADCKTENKTQPAPYCGDGVVNGSEVCDQGAGNGATCPYATSCQVCATNCSGLVNGTEPKCGDGVVQTADNEQCDGSGNLNGGTCNSVIAGSTGTLGCTAGCRYDTTNCQTCGNGTIQAGEECDTSNENGATCVSLGYGGGTLACKTDCTFNTAGCTSVCGNNKLEAGEECDGSNFPAGETCTSLGYGSGTLSCSGCKLVLSGCSVLENCGDHTIEGDEQCDPPDYNGITCTTLGYKGDSGSVIGCQATCQLDVTNCNNCLDGFQDGKETDVDCGGQCAAKCPQGDGCVVDGDCVSGLFCDRQAPHVCTTECTDHIQDGSETDEDCGGGICPACADGKNCGSNGDCVNNDCGSDGVCGT